MKSIFIIILLFFHFENSFAQKLSVEIFNKTIKNATTKKYFYTTFAEFETHLALFLQAYNFGKRLRSLKYLTPFQKLFDYYKNDKKLFNVDIENVNDLTERNI